MSQSLLFISTEGALRLATTYDNHPIPIPSVQPAYSIVRIGLTDPPTPLFRTKS